MKYLEPADYEAFGLGADTTDDYINTASALIDAHCRRPTLGAQSYTERIRLGSGTHTARLSYGPLLTGAVTAVRVRYGQPRRGEGVFDVLSLGAQIASAFGLPGSWAPLDPATLDVYAGAREIGFPVNLLGLPYNEAEITYTAGFATVPDGVKAACAQVVRNAQATPALNVRSSRIDTMQMEYFGPSLIDDGVRALLKPYLAEKL